MSRRIACRPGVGPTPMVATGWRSRSPGFPVDTQALRRGRFPPQRSTEPGERLRCHFAQAGRAPARGMALHHLIGALYGATCLRPRRSAQTLTQRQPVGTGRRSPGGPSGLVPGGGDEPALFRTTAPTRSCRRHASGVTRAGARPAALRALSRAGEMNRRCSTPKRQPGRAGGPGRLREPGRNGKRHARGRAFRVLSPDQFRASCLGSLNTQTEPPWLR